MLGPIPITAIWAYVDRYALPEWATDALISLDVEWRADEARRASAADKPAPAARQPRRNRSAAHG